jgi:hypothetical protein
MSWVHLHLLLNHVPVIGTRAYHRLMAAVQHEAKQSDQPVGATERSQHENGR